jgi:RNA polymerase sigma factor (sigma-70 family)
MASIVTATAKASGMPQNEGHLWFDLDLAVMEDDALVVLAKECEYGPARDELIVRYGGQTDRLIRWMAQPRGLSHADIEDARQSAVFWMVEAINKYDTDQIGKPQGCSFRSFVYRVVMARFKDFLKHFRRVECRYDRTAGSAGDEDFSADIDRKLNDPAAIAETLESMNRLRETLGCLDNESGKLWQLLADGINLRQIATELGVSYDSAKRRRRKLIGQLKLQLNPSRESADLAGGSNDD